MTAENGVSSTDPSNTVSVTLPPPDIRLIIDHTAQFVSKFGDIAETQLKSKNQSVKKFQFLWPASPYYPYYRAKVEGKTIDESFNGPSPSLLINQPVKQTSTDKSKSLSEDDSQQKTGQSVDQSKPEAKQRKPLRARLDELIASNQAIKDLTSLTSYTATHPLPSFTGSDDQSINQSANQVNHDVDVVKLTSLFEAVIGPSFTEELKQREQTINPSTNQSINPQFDFLRPIHPMHALNQSVKQAYTTILSSASTPYRPPSQSIKQASNQSTNPSTSQSAKSPTNQSTAQSISQSTNPPNHPSANQTIKQTIVQVFKEQVSDRSKLIDWLIASSHAKQQQEAEQAKQRIEQSNDQSINQTIDWYDFVVVDTIDFDDDDFSLDPSINQLPRPLSDVSEILARVREIKLFEEKQAEEQPINQSINPVMMDDEEQLEIRVDEPANQPVKQAVNPAVKLVTCVLCKEVMPVESLEAHMRIEMLDPTWKNATINQSVNQTVKRTALVTGKSMSDNLARIVKRNQPINQSANQVANQKQAELDAQLLMKQRIERSEPSINPANTISQSTNQTTNQSSPTNQSINPSTNQTSRPPLPTVRLIPSVQQSTVTQPINQSVNQSIHPSRLEDERDPKRQRLSSPTNQSINPPINQSANQSISQPSKAPLALFPEAEWIASHPSPITILIDFPVSQSTNQSIQSPLRLTVKLTDTIESLKQSINQSISVPVNKFQLQITNTGTFAKEASTLAFYNLQENAHLTVKVKERGGKKK